MINKSILIAALARDCNQALIKNIPKIETLRSEFKYSHIIVIENDSKDGTKETLKKWRNSSKDIELISNDFGTITIPTEIKGRIIPGTSIHRISKMTNYRNMYLEYARSVDYTIDYLIVIDIDIEDFSVKGIIESINNAPQDWGALFANGYKTFYGYFKYYYDAYAYLPLNSKNFNLTIKKLYHNNRTINNLLKKNNYIKCYSAFGGLGIYKWDIIKNNKYSMKENDDSIYFEAVCEHMPFNKKIIDSGYMNYICKNMEVKYGNRSFKHFFIYTIIPESFFYAIYRIVKRKRFGENKDFE